MKNLKDWWQRFSAMMAGLNRRERILVNCGAVFVVVFLLVRFVIVPLSGQQARLEKKLAEKKEMLQQMLTVQKEVVSVSRRVNDSLSGTQGREENFTLFSFLDQLAGEAGVKENITYMKPSTEETGQGESRLSLVELKMEAVSLENLVSYMYKIETSRSMVFVKRVSISRQEKDIGGVDAVMQVVTIAG
ncbi:MAG: type II secretion system protein GspM [Thermodesulfobacteriota bacterium]